MKAVTSPQLSEEKQAVSNDQSKRQSTLSSDTMFARIRRLEQRVQNLEVVLSTVRRDVQRIDRKQLRDAKQPSFTPATESAEFVFGGQG